MAIYLKKFETQAAYEAAESGLILPNVSLITENNSVTYKPIGSVLEKLIVTYDSDGTNPTTLYHMEFGPVGTYVFDKVEIDGVEVSVSSLDENYGNYLFSTEGVHTVEYTLKNALSLENNIFQGCYSLLSAIIPNGVVSIGAFGACDSLTSVTIPNSVTTIGDYGFYYCDELTEINLGTGIERIETSAFTQCNSLTSITMGNNVEYIGGRVFGWCGNLVRFNSNTDGVFNLPYSLTELDYGVFQGCTSMTNVNIPSGVTSIGNSSFVDCSGLTSITIEATVPPTLGSDVFENTNDCPIYVPSDSVNAYKAASGWSTYASRIQAIQ